MSLAPKTRILFILPSLCAGGAERVISIVSQNIDKELFDPILLVAGSAKDTVYDVSKVKTIYLDKSRILTALPLLILKILKLKPQIVVSSIAHVNTAMSIIAPFFKNTKFIGREATVLSKRKGEKQSNKWSPINLIDNGFKNLDAIICQSQDMAEDMILNYRVPENKIHVINNPISDFPPLKIHQPPPEIKRFITVGRLTEVKGHLRLLQILSKLDYPFEYTIIGEGSLKDPIFQKAKELGINNKIKHIPFTREVNDYLTKNDMFLQGSYVEGFPNALLESCVAGTPVIAFNVPGGTKEIVMDGINGYLVNNDSEFLERLQDNKKLWDHEEVRASVYRKFNKQHIIKQYETLFQNIVNQ